MTKLTVIIFAIFLSIISKADEMNLKSINLVEDVYVDISSEISVQKDFPMEDFMLIDFSIRGEKFLRAYVGNAPGFPSRECYGDTFEVIFNGFHRKEVKCCSDELSMEFLVNLGMERGWPKYVHFMLRKSDETQSIGIDIIDSIRIKGN